MTTQNVKQVRAVFSNMGVVGAATSYYFPRAIQSAGSTQGSFTTLITDAYVNADEYDHVQVRGSITSGDANNIVTVTIESDHGEVVPFTFAWGETPGMYDFMTGLYGAASFIANNSTTYFRVLAWNHNARLWHVCIRNSVQVAVNNSGIIEMRLVKV